MASNGAGHAVCLINGRYQLIETLGQGSQGAVFRVRDRLLPDRPTALKILAQASLDALLRFEFEQTERLSHPHLVSVYDLGRITEVEGNDPPPLGTTFFTQELVDGSGADQWVRTTDPRQRPKIVARVGVAVARALTLLHGRGLLHRDIKPSNILVGRDGALVKLIDLGLSLPKDTTGLLRSRGGTLCYMAPEAIHGFPDEESDIYALGVTLIELLTGERPQPGQPILGQRPRAAPEALWALLGRLVEPGPASRLQVASEIVLALGRAVGADVLGAEREAELIDAASDAGTEDTRAAHARSPELVGRESEQARLAVWLDRAFEGRQNGVPTAIVCGAPGVGKTRLVRAAIVSSQLRAQQTGAVPLTLLAGRLRDLLGSVIGSLPAKEVGARLRRWLGEMEDADQVDPDGATDWLIDEMTGAFTQVAQPTVLLIEDGDAPLVPLLLDNMYYTAPPDGSAQLVVIAEMGEQAYGASRPERHDTLKIDVLPLDKEAETQLVQQALGRRVSQGFLARLHALTGGVPLLTEAVLAALTAARPDGRVEEQAIDDLSLSGDPGQLVLQGLWSGLPETARVLAQSLAVIDKPASIDDVLSISGVTEAKICIDTVHQLERRGWLTRDAKDRLSLPGLVSRCLLKSSSDDALRPLFKRSVALFEARGREDPGYLADHAAGAGLNQKARTLSREAVRLRLSAGDLSGAAQYLELLLTLGTSEGTDRDMTQLARLYRQTGQYEESEELALKVERRGGAEASRAALERAAVLRLVGNTEDAIALLSELISSSEGEIALEAGAIASRIELDRGALATAEARLDGISLGEDPRLVRTGVLATAGLIALTRGDLHKAAAVFKVGLSTAKKMGDLRNQARFRGLFGMVHHGTGDWEAALESYRRARGLAEQASDRHGAATYAVNQAAALTELDRIEEALDAYRAGLAGLRRVGRMVELAQAGANYAQLLLRVGDTSGADVASQKAVEHAKEAAEGRALALALCVRGDVLLALGQLDEAASVLAEAEQQAETAEAGSILVLCRQHLAAQSLAQGEPARAVDWLLRAEGSSSFLRSSHSIEQCRLKLLAAEGGQGDVSEALDALVRVLPGSGERRLEDHLVAFATAARSAVTTGNDALALHCASIVLEGTARIRRATPSLHRQEDDSLSMEMKMIVEARRKRAAKVEDTRIDWEPLVPINTRLNSEFRIGRLLEMVMDAALDITGAQRGFLLISNSKAELRIRCARNIDREKIADEKQSYSHTVALRAFEQGEPVLTTDAQEDERFQATLSVMDLNLRYIVAVPLKVKGKTTGTIYLDSQRGGQFEGGRLALLEALADQAAIALTNARLTLENRQRERRIQRLLGQLESRLASREGELEKIKGELERQTEKSIERYSDIGIVARSSAMAEMFKLLDKVKDSDLPVIIQGESGTGKELVARAVHFGGGRRRGPFVAENCAAIPEALLESALFGHIKGAFTGAIQDTRGLFVEADGGTLFLDEVSEMPLSMQAKLLRVLQDGEVRPVGGGQTKNVDVRIVVASNTELAQRVKAGAFREDLYYRLNVVSLVLPPLRQRVEDIPLLAEHFAQKHGGGAPPRLSQEALEALIDHPWPGNVRQLENEMMRAIVLSDGVIEISHLSEDVVSAVAQVSDDALDLDLNAAVNKLKKRLVTIALRRTGGNQSAAAKLLGLSRYGLQKMMTRLEVSV